MIDKLLGGSMVILALAGCDGVHNPKSFTNKTLEHQYFVECLKNLPAGPETTHYNDWDEVIDSCRQAASIMATTTTYYDGSVR